ncbi:MAG: methyltransferase domain-containing protein [Gaiellaceae bacterium]
MGDPAAPLAPDTWERHALAARLAGSPGTLLDVGGEGLLRRYLLGTEVTTANVEPPADVLLAGPELPFADGSFEAATSIDVLEHLPAAERAAHVAELRRVARETVVLTTPLGTPEHVEAERELAEWHEAVTGRRHRYLDEHLRHGLPTPEELAELGEGGELFFHGDFRRAAELFRFGVRRRPLDLVRLALARRDRELSPLPQRFTNRAFVRFTSVG